LKDLGHEWGFHDPSMFDEWLHDTCRFTKDERWKYLGEVPLLVKQASEAMRIKLKQRLKNMRHKQDRFKSRVLGGIVCYEATINVDPETKTMRLHPHLHAILHGKYYTQSDLQDDWGLGIVDIRKISNRWIAQLEVAKYVGKDGSRRTAWGSVRKQRSKMLQELANNSKLVDQ
jgi:CTP-dependent riboflavin kinase